MRRPDSKRQLIEYFKKNLSKKYPVDSLRFALVRQGYSRVAVNQAMEEAHKEIAEKAPILKERPIIKYELYNEKNQPIEIEPFSILEKIKFFFKGREY